MTEYRIDARLFRDMVISAAGNLEQNKEKLNDLNVFPVPDGDTGTNMMLTLLSSAKEVNAAEQKASVGELIYAMSHGALKGARGNSGVILSQIFRGFAQAIPPDADFITSADFAAAMEAGVASAYKAIMRPKEGTILTVAKSMAHAASEAASSGLNVLMLLDEVLEKGHKTLLLTPEMLPVLKEAGVVDAGGAGLLVIFRGFKMAIDGEEVAVSLDLSLPKQEFRDFSNISTADIEFGYCTEFLLINVDKGVTEAHITKYRDKLDNIGDSVVVVSDADMIKTHVHTNDPGKALQFALRLGDITGVKIENMREQNAEILRETEAKTPYSIVSVAAGPGLSEIFKDFNVERTVHGGQSMNPSAEDILREVDACQSGNVIILPNNKNIILAAEQAGELSRKTVYVVPSKSFPQGLAAVLAVNFEKEIGELVKDMKSALKTVKTAQVTAAVRDSVAGGLKIKKGHFIGILEGDIVSCDKELAKATEKLLSKMVTDSDAVISFYTGEDAPETVSSEIVQSAAAAYPTCDVEVYDGGQPVYNYIISVE